MSRNLPRDSRFERFMRWAEGGEPKPEQRVAEAPEWTELTEYLEYLGTHEYMDFGAFCFMRLQERKDEGPAPQSSHDYEPHETEEKPDSRRKRRQPGRLRRVIRAYRILSVLVAVVLMSALLLVMLEMPRFGAADAPAVNEVSGRYLEQGVEETGAVNAVAGMILDYRAFDTFGESTVLFAATMSVVLLLRGADRKGTKAPREGDRILNQMGRIILPAVMMYGIYVVLNGHLSPGGGFSGGTVLGCGLILGALILGEERMEQLLPHERLTQLSVGCLLAYGLMKGYSFLTGANHIGWEIPKGTPGAIFSAGFILPLNICVGIIVACTMYTFYTLFIEREE